MKFYIPLVLSLLIPSLFFGQLYNATRHFEDGEYSLAIPLYQKVLKKHPDSHEALQKLASCYRILKKYPEAEKYYAQVVAMSYVDPIDHFYYGLALKNNGKIDEAKKQFLRYSLLTPGDKAAEVSVRSCDDIKLWVTRGKKFTVEPLKGINSELAEFCPVIYYDEILFAL